MRNKLGITDGAELARVEERISKAKAVSMYESGMLGSYKPGSFETLAAIHRYLFEDVYDFAGKIRSVDISKNGFRFASVLYLEDAIRKVERMPQSSFEEIVEKYVEMNVVHPFREGNGRSMRLWLGDMLEKELGLIVDWSRIDGEDYILAMERSPVRDKEIKSLLANALTERTRDIRIFMKGVDASYAYEGMQSVRTRDVAKGTRQEFADEDGRGDREGLYDPEQDGPVEPLL